MYNGQTTMKDMPAMERNLTGLPTVTNTTHEKRTKFVLGLFRAHELKLQSVILSNSTSVQVYFTHISLIYKYMWMYMSSQNEHMNLRYDRKILSDSTAVQAYGSSFMEPVTRQIS